nr:regulatory protein RecX [Gordonia shandongensis]
MRDRLTQKGFSPDEVSATIDRLDRWDLLDDEQFAADWVRARHAGSGRGRLALRRELRAKGVDDETISEALAQIDPDREREIAQEIAVKKLAVRGEALGDRDEWNRAYRRLTGVLGRRGFPPEMITSVVGEVLAEAREA